MDRLNLPFFDPEYYNSFEEIGHVELIGDNKGLRKDGENIFTMPDRLPADWFHFPKEKLIQLFMACPPEIHKKLHGHPKLFEEYRDNPRDYPGLNTDPQVLSLFTAD